MQRDSLKKLFNAMLESTNRVALKVKQEDRHMQLCKMGAGSAKEIIKVGLHGVLCTVQSMGTALRLWLWACDKNLGEYIIAWERSIKHSAWLILELLALCYRFDPASSIRLGGYNCLRGSAYLQSRWTNSTRWKPLQKFVPSWWEPLRGLEISE